MKKGTWISAIAAVGALAMPLGYPANAAETAPAPAPMQTPTSSAPTTQPSSREASVKVLLLSLESTGSEQLNWIGKGVRDDLLAELARPMRPRATGANATDIAALHPILLEEIPSGPITPQTARRLADDAGAAYVIFGTYQVLDQEVRLTAQVMDASTGQYVGAMKATGSLRDLFSLQDELARQAKAVLRPAAIAMTPHHNAPVAEATPPALPPAPTPGATYGGSDLRTAVEAGHLAFNPPPAPYAAGYDTRSYWYSNSSGATGYYGYYYYPYSYYPSCYRPPRAYCPVYIQPYIPSPVGYYPVTVIGSGGYGYFSGIGSGGMPANTQGYVRMTTR